MLNLESRLPEKHIVSPQQEALSKMDVFHTFPEEEQREILEIVEFCALCLEKYFKDFDIPKIEQGRFFVFTNETAPEGNEKSFGIYDPKLHLFGVREDALYRPKVYLHEMIHFIAKEKLPESKNTGYQFSVQEEIDNELVSYTFYTALNEGMTDLMTEEAYSFFYNDLKHFFEEYDGMDSFVSAYSDSIIFVQKLIEYNALILSTDENIPEEEAHAQVWNLLKKGYLTNDVKYLEELLETFGDSDKEKEQVLSSVRNLEITNSRGGVVKLTRILDKKINLARQWRSLQN